MAMKSVCVSLAAFKWFSGVQQIFKRERKKNNTNPELCVVYWSIALKPNFTAEMNDESESEYSIRRFHVSSFRNVSILHHTLEWKSLLLIAGGGKQKQQKEIRFPWKINKCRCPWASQVQENTLSKKKKRKKWLWICLCVARRVHLHFVRFFFVSVILKNVQKQCTHRSTTTILLFYFAILREIRMDMQMHLNKWHKIIMN